MVTAGYLEKTVTVDGLSLAYQEWGNPSAPPVVMLHGFGVSGHMFDEFADRMQDRYRLLALDQRGHGDSDWSEAGDYSRDAFISDVEGFRKALGLEQFHLIGHSMGGLNAVAYMNAHPERVKTLVLVDVGPEAAKQGVDNIMRFTRGPDELEFEEFVEMAHRFNQRRTLENIRERMRHRLKPSESGKWTWKFDKRFRQPDSGLTIGSGMSNDESWQLFRNISVPTLIVRGGESDVLTPAVAERCAQEMPRARLTVIPGAGHSVPGDNPDAFTEAVREFLADVERGHFEPAAAPAPPLERLLEEHSAASRRGPSMLTLIAAGVGAAFALAGAGYLLKRAADNRKKQKTVRGKATAAAQQVHLPPVDVDAARERAAEVVNRLGEVGAASAKRARQKASEVDIARARVAAHEALALLSVGTHQAPAVVKSAVERVDTKAVKQRGSSALARGVHAGSLALQLANQLAHRKQKPRHRVARWRN
jgi:proline-specific peptidase